jgi:hypothetical protein
MRNRLLFSPTDSGDSSSRDCSPVRTRTRPAGALQPDRTRDPTRTRLRAARQLGTSPPAHELRAAGSRRAARTRRPRTLARVHARTSPLAPWLRIPSAITERSRAPERGLPGCYQLLVAARQPTMSKGADGCRPSCLTCQRHRTDPAPEKRNFDRDRVRQEPLGQVLGRGGIDRGALRHSDRSARTLGRQTLLAIRRLPWRQTSMCAPQRRERSRPPRRETPRKQARYRARVMTLPSGSWVCPSVISRRPPRLAGRVAARPLPFSVLPRRPPVSSVQAVRLLG